MRSPVCSSSLAIATLPTEAHRAVKFLALVACACVGFGCGMRTDLLSSVDAQVVPPPTDGPRSPDTPPDLPIRRDGPPDPLPDLRPADLAVEAPVDLKPQQPDSFPDTLPDRGPDRFPDLPPDLLRDLPPDLRTDLLRDVVPDFPPDLPPDQPRERFVDLPADLPPGPEVSCSSGSTLPCGCDNGLLGSRICLPSLVYSECGCGTDAVMRVKNGLIGTWTGTATTPWVPTYHVTFTFDSYTHYASRALDGGGTPALYYGSDQDSPLKQYDITDVQANGDALGTIDIYFGESGTTRDSLQSIQLSADLSRLKFSVMHLDQYGPLQYDLQRTSP
jgi:hypothetical protein